MSQEHSKDYRCPDVSNADVSITIGPDGRMLFHDLTAESLPVACAMCPGDPELKQRAEALALYRKDEHGTKSRQ